MVELVRIMDRYPELTQSKTTATAEDVRNAVNFFSLTSC